VQNVLEQIRFQHKASCLNRTVAFITRSLFNVLLVGKEIVMIFCTVC